MKTRNQFPSNQMIHITVLALILVLAPSARAAIVGPYLPDANTLHLWHLDEVAPPCSNTVLRGRILTALGNGATLGNSSFSGFGAALSTYDGGPNGLQNYPIVISAASSTGVMRIRRSQSFR